MIVAAGFRGESELSGKCPGISGRLGSEASDCWISRCIWDAGSGALDALMKRPLLSLGGAMVLVL